MTAYGLPARQVAQRRSSSNEPYFGYLPAKHEAPLCWGCFLPIFGNRPGMFDGDLLTCFTEDDEDAIHGNTHGHLAHYPTWPRFCSNVAVEHDTCCPQFAPIDRETSSPLVTIPSPISCKAEIGVAQELLPHNGTNTEQFWEDNEPPELTFSNATSVKDSSSLNASDSHCLNALDYGRAYNRDMNCNVMGGIKIEAVLHQAGMQIPFAATIPFPRVENTASSGLGALPLSKEQEVLIVGQMQVGAQKISFEFSQ